MSALGKLYIIPTPIGNLEDMTFRAIRILKEVDLILAEDTRTTSFLLKHFEIVNKMQSYHKFNEHKTVNHMIDLLLSGTTIGLVSDAGTPAISDPGFLISRECIKAGIDIECLPGATAFVPALVNSGIPCDKFFFEGFLPPKKGRATRLKILSEFKNTIIIYESPYRIVKTLTQLSEVMGGDRYASVSREISKLHEETARGSLSELIEHFSLKDPKGEFVLIIEGKQE